MMRLLKSGGIALGTLSLLATTAMAQTGTIAKTGRHAQGIHGKDTPLSAKDRDFMRMAAQGGLTEVRLGEIAEKQAASDGVKQFGQQMVQDHSKANDELKALAASKGVTLPTTPGAKNEKVIATLSKLSGVAFDKAYVSDMVKDHKEDVSEFAKAAKKCKDPDVKAWAQKTLPTLQMHLKHVQSLTKSAHK